MIELTHEQHQAMTNNEPEPIRFIGDKNERSTERRRACGLSVSKRTGGRYLAGSFAGSEIIGQN